MCTRVYVPRWWVSGKRFEIYPPFFHHRVCHENPSNYVFGDVVAHDFDLHSKNKDSNPGIHAAANARSRVTRASTAVLGLAP